MTNAKTSKVDAKAEVAENVKKEKSSKKVDPKADVKKASTKKAGPIAAVVLFIRQIIDEMKKVTAPTKDELVEYSIVVLVFVLVIMLFITGVDFLIGKGIMAIFA